MKVGQCKTKENTHLPYIRPATNNYFGFQPVSAADGNIQTNPYLVSSSEGAIYTGDVVVFTSINTIRAITGAFSSMIAGVSAGFLAANGGSTAATLSVNTSQLALVYDNPYQVFVTCDTTSGLIGSTGMFKNVAVLSSGAVGSTGPNTAAPLNRSVMAISGVTASSGLALPFKVLGLHPIENNSISTDAGGAGVAASVRKWLVTPNNHIFAKGVGQYGVITS